MDTGITETGLLEEGKSSELSAALRLLAEATDGEGRKFSDMVCREVARAIVCRTYASAVHELCHLVVAAAACDHRSNRYEPFFWNSGPARAATFRGYVAAAGLSGERFATEGGQLDIRYGDGTFAVSYGRMPFLSALLEFLMTVLGYADLDEALQPVSAEFPDMKAVSQAAGELSKKVYDYLREHLPSVQTQRKQRSFVAFLKGRAGERGVTPASVSDESILDFWLAHSADEDGEATDAKTYQGVFTDAVRLARAMMRAGRRSAVDNPAVIGTDREAGEIDPANVDDLAAHADDEERQMSDFREICESRVKFLNGREWESLDGLLAAGGLEDRLARSMLRNAVFGRGQFRVIQAVRKKMSAAEMERFIETATETDYGEKIAEWRKLLAHVERVMLAGLGALAAAGRREAIPLALELEPGLAHDFEHLTGESDDPQVLSMAGERAARAFMEGLQAPGDDVLGALARNAERALKGLSRKGFSEDDRRDSATVEGFAVADAPLRHVRRMVTGFVDRHSAGVDWAEQFGADRPVFEGQFKVLYGGKNG